MHPTGILPNILHFVGVLDIWHWMKILLRNAAGNLSPDERKYIPDSEVPKAILAARIHIAIYAAMILATVWMLPRARAGPRSSPSC